MNSLGNHSEIERLLIKSFKAKLDDPKMKGRVSAQETLDRRKIDDPNEIKAVLELGLSFREFQSMALYHSRGFFPSMTDYKTDMPLLPQGFSPIFGIMVAEWAFANYLIQNPDSLPQPTFLGLGSGAAYLDKDLIDHLTGNLFEQGVGGFIDHARMLGQNAKFMVTDVGTYATSASKGRLRRLIKERGLEGRVEISKLDAMDFDLHNQPFGIVYANELMDNLPTEPVVEIDGQFYCMRIIPHVKDKPHEGEAERRLSAKHSDLGGVLSKPDLDQRLDGPDYKKVGFTPFFIPLDSDPELRDYAEQVGFRNRINTPDFGGIYPLHVSVDKMFSSIKRSFARGIVILIDYFSVEQGAQNWNVAVNKLRNYTFGSEDFDFRVDPEQISQIAGKVGMKTEGIDPLEKSLSPYLELATIPNFRVFQRWANAQGIHNLNETEKKRFLYTWAIYSKVLPHHKVMTFSF